MSSVTAVDDEAICTRRVLKGIELKETLDHEPDIVHDLSYPRDHIVWFVECSKGCSEGGGMGCSNPVLFMFTFARRLSST
jgi:hypothetical protein